MHLTVVGLNEVRTAIGTNAVGFFVYQVMPALNALVSFECVVMYISFPICYMFQTIVFPFSDEMLEHAKPMNTRTSHTTLSGGLLDYILIPGDFFLRFFLRRFNLNLCISHWNKIQIDFDTLPK